MTRMRDIGTVEEFLRYQAERKTRWQSGTDVVNTTAPPPLGRGAVPPHRVPSAPPPLERDILAAVLELVQLHPAVAWAERMNTGGMEQVNSDGTKRYIKFAFKGCSDIIGMMRDGRFLAIEVKRPGGKASEDQLAFIYRVRNGNGVAFVCWSIEDVMRGLRKPLKE